MSAGRISVYDTTLRDGMQTEGISFSLEDKLAIAKCLDQLGVDYIEGGYAASNPKELQFFEQVQKLGLKNSKIAAFGSTRRADRTVEDDLSINSILRCKAPVATIVGKSWDLHVEHVLKCSLDESLKIISESVMHLKKAGLEVIYDAEHFYDGYKNNPEFTLKTLAAAAEAGADCLALCDTNGGCLPEQITEITRTVAEQFGTVQIGIHTHNDTECAVANSIAAVRAGARHVQGTINGLGERCGNANLCSVVANLALKTDYEVLTPEKIQTLTEVSRLICEIANLNPMPHAPYVGESAFAHKAGLHVDALRKNTSTYEHIDPALVGNERRFLISELSGKANILNKLEKQRISDDKVLVRKVLNKVQDMENQGYQFEAAEATFELMVKKLMGTYKSAFELIKYHVSMEKHHTNDEVTEATVKLKVGENIEHVVAEGDGPVNALDAALRKSLEDFYPQLREIHLVDYKVRVVNAKAGTAARVRVIIECRDRHSTWGTVGVSGNIIEASWLALVDSIEYKLQP